jgi:putative membrane protein
MSHVSDIYREATGIGGYPFIRAFILSMMTEGNDQLIESFFDKIGVVEDVKIQYLAIRTTKEKKLKGLFFIPNIHFGPFKTCGSSDLPEHIYKEFEHVIGTTVYHTTNDHTQNLTSQQEVDKVLDQIRNDINKIESDDSLTWTKDIKNVTRKISNSAKLIGTVVDNTAIIFVTRHPLPSDDIQAAIGDKINQIAKDYGYNDIIIIDSHNSIIGDEILIRPKSFEAKDIVSVAEKFLRSIKKEKSQEGVNYKVHYGVVRDSLDQYDEKDGIGYGGLVVHMFKDTNTNQKSVFIHFDGNNAYVDIRSYILNMLQNRGIERGEVTTSDSHTVARKFTKRAYSPIGEKIKLQTILEKLDMLLPAANQDLQEVEFCYYKSIIPNIKIWGDPKYFDVIMNTLQECIRISQRLLTLSLILPTFFSLILLLFFYQITDVFNIF